MNVNPTSMSGLRDPIEEIINPFLIQQGFLQRTPRGRVLTPNAFRHLGLAEPDRSVIQMSLIQEDSDGRHKISGVCQFHI